MNKKYVCDNCIKQDVCSIKRKVKEVQDEINKKYGNYTDTKIRPFVLCDSFIVDLKEINPMKSIKTTSIPTK